MPDEWDLTDIDCKGAAKFTIVGGVAVNVDLQAGENVTCTFTNTNVAPKLKLVKKVSNNDGGDGVLTVLVEQGEDSDGEIMDAGTVSIRHRTFPVST